MLNLDAHFYYMDKAKNIYLTDDLEFELLVGTNNHRYHKRYHKLHGKSQDIDLENVDTESILRECSVDFGGKYFHKGGKRMIDVYFESEFGTKIIQIENGLNYGETYEILLKQFGHD